MQLTIPQVGENEELGAAVEEFGKFLDREVRPRARKHDGSMLEKPQLQALWDLIRPYGIGTGLVPTEQGGLGLGYLASGALYEKLSEVWADIAIATVPHEAATLKILAGATDEFKAANVPDLIAGRKIACSAISEPQAGSNIREIKTRARATANGYVITGEKIWISNVPIADIVLTLAKTRDDELTIFAVDTSAKGITRRNIPTLGFDAAPFGSIHYDEVEVPASSIVGGLGGGRKVTMHGFERVRIFAAVMGNGIAAAALELAIDYAKTRQQFGYTIGAFQLVQQTIAEMATLHEAARLLTYRALAKIEQGIPCGHEAAMAKAYATEAAVKIASSAIQPHGSMGISREFELEHLFRSARMLLIPDGTTHINQLIIARGLLGIDAFRPKPPAAAGKWPTAAD